MDRFQAEMDICMKRLEIIEIIAFFEKEELSANKKTPEPVQTWTSEMLDLIREAQIIIDQRLLTGGELDKLQKEVRMAEDAVKNYRYNSAIQSARARIRLRVALGLDNEMLLYAAYDID